MLDIDPAIGLGRAASRKGSETRFESMDIAFHQHVREGFLTLARQEPSRIIVIDASGEPKEVHRAILQALAARGILLIN